MSTKDVMTGGELGALTRAFDWSSTPLGPIDSWQQSLRTIVSIVHAAGFPMIALWGPDLIQIYNDGYGRIMGPRHPKGLGKANRECWPEVWAINEPIYARVLAGESVTLEDALYPLSRNGMIGEAWFTLSYSPLRDDHDAIAGVLVTLFETTDRILAQRQRDADMQRQRRQFEEAPGFIAISGGPEHVYEFTNEAYERLVGRRDFIGKTVREALPDIAGQGFYERLDAVYATGQRFVAEHMSLRMQRVSGAALEERFCDLIYEPVFDENGRVTGIFTQGHDVTDRMMALAALEERERELQLLTDALPVLVSYVDSDERYRFNNKIYEEWFLRRREDIEGKQLREVVGETAYAAVKPWIDRALAGERVKFEQFMPYDHIAARHIQVEYVPRVRGDGRVEGFYALVQDISLAKHAEAERYKSDEHLRLLVNELNHRVKNSLATVQAIAAQTFRDQESFQQAKREFSARILTLAKAHDILTEANWTGASMREIIQRTVDPYHGSDADRFRLDGPDVSLAPKSALSLSMALHELCTNAAKYGALSNDAGHVDVIWSVEAEAAGPRMRIRWEESGGPEVGPPLRKGFGSRLIEYALAAELDGNVTIAYEPTGVVCIVDAPLPAA